MSGLSLGLGGTGSGGQKKMALVIAVAGEECCHESVAA
jgi:hypothetical protein